MTKSPKKSYSVNYKRTKSPRSYLRYFKRVSFARNLAQIHVALADLVPRLLRLGQSPEEVAHDLSQLASVHGFHDCIAPVVNDLAMREAAR
ncbi:hypothetical protein [Ralstonia mannitolilytica]|uniref:hypothetical protein n=1 Tax=Ralstonia mannitolilytica TaxID=105219 RepID=UPI001425BAF0|nr:hypothetical protein [Ralstonia mannitolilytica]